MDAKIRREHRFIKAFCVQRPSSSLQREPPVEMINKCVALGQMGSESDQELRYTVKNIFHYLHLCSDEELTKFCEIFPFLEFMNILLKPASDGFEAIQTMVLRIVSICSSSDFFPVEQFCQNDMINFLFARLDSSSSDDVSSAMDIFVQMIIRKNEIGQLLVEKGIHDKMLLLNADASFSAMISALCLTHPESMPKSLSFVPYCLQIEDPETIKFALNALYIALEYNIELVEVVLSIIIQYKDNLFNISQDDVTKLLFKILSLPGIGPLPLCFFVPTLNKLMNCNLKIFKLANIIFQNQANQWRGVHDEMLCMILQGQMIDLPFEDQKVVFETILVYYPWDQKVDIKLTSDLIKFLSDNDLCCSCLYILCHLIETFPNEKELIELIYSSLPIVETLFSREDEKISALAERFIQLVSPNIK